MMILSVIQMREQLDFAVKEIIKGASEGMIPTTYGGLRIQFDTNIENKISFQNQGKCTLFIDDYSSLLDVLERYVKTLIESNHSWSMVPSRVKIDVINQDVIRDYLAYLLMKATPWDLKHPVEFVDRYRQFLIEQTFVEEQVYELESFDCKLQVRREAQDYGQETPYAFIPTLIKEIDGVECKCVLPYLRYGVAYENGEQRCYLYAI